MKNLVCLQKNDDGKIVCWAISEKGAEFSKAGESESTDFWNDGGTILLEELEEILDREV